MKTVFNQTQSNQAMIITTLSIIVPVYNEEATIALILNNIKNVNLVNDIKKEIIVINDCSTDNTGNEIENFISENPSVNIHYCKHEVNKGKGAALKTGISLAKGEYLVIQDADFEYDPEEYNDLLKPVLKGFADVVYGSRFVGGNPQRKLFFWHQVGNRYLTSLTNLFSNLNLTDMETCFKLFNTKILQSIILKENRFGFEPEVTIKISRVRKIRIYEVGISYYGRGYEEGKKIGWKDGFRAVYCIFKYGLFRA
jgi:glycosyltransferase involved in cell wall biosynthesis